MNGTEKIEPADKELKAPPKHIGKQWELSQIFHWVVWIVMPTWSMWKFSQSPTRFKLLKRRPEVFDAGIYGIPYMQDTSDTEWQFGLHAIESFWLQVLMQPLISQTLLRRHPQYLPHFYGCFSILFLTWNIGWESALIHITQFVCFYVAGCLKSKVLCYLLTLAMVGHNHAFEIDFLSVGHAILLFPLHPVLRLSSVSCNY